MAQASIEIPSDVQRALKAACAVEDNPAAARGQIAFIL
jgi:tartrate dehydratase alpha subunit/fumarate hydratase class I-like protein